MKNWKRRILAGVLAVTLIVSGIWIGNQASVVDAATLPENANVGDTITLSDGTSVEIVQKTSLTPGHTVTDLLVQFGRVYNWGLSGQTTLSFEGTVMLDGEVLNSSSYRFDGYYGTDTIALYANEFSGKVLTILAGSVIYYDGKAVVITATFNQTYDSGNWTSVSDVPVYEEDSYIWIDGKRRVIQKDVALQGGNYGTNDLAQFDVGYAFTCPADNTTLGFYGTLMLDGEKEIVNITEDATPRFVGYPSGNTITLFRDEIAGKLVTILEGSIFYYGDNAVRVSKDFNSTYTSGGNWTANPRVPGKEYVELSDGTLKEKVATITLTPGHTAPTLVQFTNVNDFGVDNNVHLGFSGTLKLDGEPLVVDDKFYFSGYKDNTTICLNFGPEHTNKVVTIEKDSVIYYGDKAVVIGETFNQKWDGSSWTPVAEIPSPADTTISFSAVSYSTNGLIQVKTSLPTDTVCNNDTSNWEVSQSGRLQFNSVSEVVSGDTYYIAFNFAENFETGETYVLGKDSIFVFGEKQYKLDKTYTFYCTGSEFVVIEGEFSFTDYNYATAGTIRWKTTLPVTSATGDGNNYIKTSGLSVKTVALFTDVDPYVLQFVFTSNATEGDKFTVEKGSVFQSGGAYYSLDDTYIFLYTGGDRWTMIKGGIVGTFGMKGVHYGTAGLVQAFHAFSEEEFGTAYTATPTAVYLKESGQYLAQGFQMYNDSADGRKVFQINFKGSYSADETYVLEKGSMVQFADGVRELDANYILTYNGTVGATSWTCQKEGDANIDYTIDSRDLVRVKTAESVPPENIASCDIVVDSVVNQWDTSAMRQILLDTYVRHADAISTAEYLLDPERFNGGGEFVTFADRPADPTNPEKIQEYKAAGFNTATVTGEYGDYQQIDVKVAEGSETYKLQKGEEKLTLTAKGANNANMFQVATNLPAGDGYKNFLPIEIATRSDVEFTYANSNGSISYFQYSPMEGTVYLNPIYTDKVLKDGESFTYKAGSKFQVNGTWYALTADYTVTYRNAYQASIKNLDAADLNVWIRNTSNKKGYFTQDRLNVLQPYTDVIDGIYVADEPFTTAAIQSSSNSFTGETEDLMTFEQFSEDSEKKWLNWFNENLPDKYFFVNHVGMPAYNHYMESPQSDAPPVSEYEAYYDKYKTDVLTRLGDSTKKPLSFDLYPLGYDKRTRKREWNPIEGFYYVWQPTKWQSEGIDPYYLVTMLTVANKAKEQGNIFSYYIQAQNNKSFVDSTGTRALKSSAEISMQLYAGMACGAKMYGYFLYNALADNPDNGMIRPNGTHNKMYDWVQEANQEALPFADVLKTFEWNGAEFFLGTSKKNSEAKDLLSQELVLNNDSNGVLNSEIGNITADHDILVGHYKKGGQDAYMIANYNDPELVDTPNNVTLKFDGCNYARVYTGDVEKGLTSRIEPLDADGSYKFTLQPGGGCFVIPVKATS